MTWIIDERQLGLNTDAAASVFAVGNGQICTRGTVSEADRGAFRGVYVAGSFTRAGYARPYPFTAPDWTQARLEIDGARVMPDESWRLLDMRNGVLTRSARLTCDGTTVELVEERFASLADPALLAQRFRLHVAGAAGLQFVLGVDGQVYNSYGKYYVPGELPNCTEQGLRLSRVETLNWREDGCGHVRLRALGADDVHDTVMRVTEVQGQPLACRHICTDDEVRAEFTLQPGEYVIDKLVRMDGGAPVDTWESARTAGDAAWAEFWSGVDVTIEGDARAQQAIRFAVFSTRIAAPNDGGRSSLGAKNLTGDWYLGGVFWDMELFQLPMLAAIAPALVANHIRYRANRMAPARILAGQDGYRGARVPWTSYGTGFEEPPDRQFTYHEIHVNAAVMWGVLHYHVATGDDDLMLEAGCEILIELARYWCSRMTVGPHGRWHLRDVVGPDEEHQGTDDNAYTNLMASTMLRRTRDLLSSLGARHPARMDSLMRRLGCDPNEVESWYEIAGNVYVPTLADSDVPAQFEGWEGFCEPDGTEQAKGIGRDRCNKQADVLMSYQPLPDLHPVALQRRCYAEYAPLGNHTSSLSMCVHARLAARYGLLRDALRFYDFAIGIDLEDTAANTSHGIHGAGEGGIWLATVNGFGGLRFEAEGVVIDPQLPPDWKRLAYRCHVAGQRLSVTVMPEEVVLLNEGTQPITIGFGPDARDVTLTPQVEQRLPHRAAWVTPQLGAVIFDLDGVLVTTDVFHYQAWKALADKLGLAFDEHVNHRLRGVSRGQSLRTIYEHNDVDPPPEPEFTAHCIWKNARYVELIDGMDETHILPGARELLLALREAGIGIGIASASRNARRVLERTGLLEFVDVIGDGTIVSAPKPDAQVFYLAAQRLRCLPWNCLGVEDAAAGVESIRRAGMVSVGIGEAASAADACFGGTDQLSVSALCRLWTERRPAVNPYYERNRAKMQAEQAEAGQGRGALRARR